MMRRYHLIPVAIFIALAGGLYVGLDPDRNPKAVPSALIDQPVPEFALPPVEGRGLGLASADLRGEVALVNVFASWCGPCRVEHPLLMDLAAKRVVAVHGINYKDQPKAAAEWLLRLGDPYTRTGADRDGRVSIDWGVYGVPETFVVDRAGRIRYKHVGPLQADDLEQKILPLIRRLQG
ncbi:MAG: DsbE family thiol:disulfide interchange protein [Alphaproteobacteria bacterium]|nr:DsbE family thiol:disulfide interchange protein [Alphaproteobacteria bacterium]